MKICPNPTSRLKLSVSFLFKFSLIDVRPRYSMAEVCQQHNVKLLTYGTVVGLPHYHLRIYDSVAF